MTLINTQNWFRFFLLNFFHLKEQEDICKIEILFVICMLLFLQKK